MTWALLVMGCLVVAVPARAQTTLYTFNGDSVGDFFGVSVSGAGDVNGDGFADLIVGAAQDDNNGADAGSARVLSGLNGSVLYTFNGDSPFDFFGVSVSGAGDVDGDGYADLIVGARGDDNNGERSGSARVFSGLDGSILYTFDGDSAADTFGASVSGAGDVNGDGFADLIVGAAQDDNNGFSSGSARVFSGLDGSILFTFDGDSAIDLFGISVSGAGDVDGDGFADLIVGARRDDNNGDSSGSARVFSGADGSVLYTFNGDSPFDFFGGSVSGAGDVDGDGFADLIVGAHLDDNNGTDSGSARVFSGLFVPPDALTLLEQLIQDVVDLNLQQGINNSLDAKLDAVIQALQDVNENNDVAAINALQAFINAVQAQSGIHIPVADADALIAKAQAIIDLLSL